MTGKLPLTLACGDYEIVRPLLERKVEVDGVDLTILTDMDSATRHWRFLRNNEFDVAEVSISSYLAARDNDWPFRAIPVFLHRRFRHGFMFINTGKGIAKPADLKGRRIGVKTLMTSAVLWMRGMLQHEYGVPLEQHRMGRRAQQRRRRAAAAGHQIHTAAARQIGRDHAGRGRARRRLSFRSDQAVPGQGPARGAPVPRSQGRGDGLLPTHRHFPDHARAGHPAGAGRASIPGSRSTCSAPSTRQRRWR